MFSFPFIILIFAEFSFNMFIPRFTRFDERHVLIEAVSCLNKAQRSRQYVKILSAPFLAHQASSPDSASKILWMIIAWYTSNGSAAT